MRRRPVLRDARLLLVALVAVARVRADLWLHRHTALRRQIAAIAARHPAAPTPDRGALAEVAWSVAASARWVPGATCLTQATAGQLLLARRGIGSRVRISLPSAGEGFRPHAWLIADDTILLGGSSLDHAAHRTLHELVIPPAPRQSP